ncbi:MAG: FKBP-type peptidyl-prolyl cis-trans isomerase, partial [Planctomycetota bacterium]
AEALESQPQPEPASPAPSAGLIAPVNFEPGEADPWRGWERDGDLRVLTVDMRPTAARIQPGGFVHYRQRVLTPGGRVIEALSTPLHRYAMAGVTPMLDPVERGLSGLRVGERRLVAVPRGLWPEDWRRAAGRSSAEALVLELAVVDLNPGVDVQTLVGGRGPEVRPGDRVEAHWIAFVGEQAKPMDSTRQQGAPRSLVVGAGQVIAGLEHGLIGMRVGETRRIGVPPALGFGERGLPPMIPPGASVTYQVRLESLEPATRLEPLAPAPPDPAA